MVGRKRGRSSRIKFEQMSRDIEQLRERIATLEKRENHVDNPFAHSEMDNNDNCQMPEDGHLKVQKDDVEDGEHDTELPEVSPATKPKNTAVNVGFVAPLVQENNIPRFSGLKPLENQEQIAIGKMERYIASEKSYVVNVDYPTVFLGKEFIDKIHKENIKEAVDKKMLTTTSLCLYIRYLCDKFSYHEFCFISPYEIHDYSKGNKPLMKKDHISRMIGKCWGNDKTVIVPFNVGYHWVLIAINTQVGEIYYMDPAMIPLDGRWQMHNFFNKVMTLAQTGSGVNALRKTYNKYKWITFKCPKQKYNNPDCGYIVYFFIEAILSKKETNLPNYFMQVVDSFTFSSKVLEFQR